MSPGRSRIAGASVALCIAAPASAQTLGQGGGPDVSWVRVVLALLFCLALAVAAALALRYRFRGAVRIAPGGDRRLRLVETLRLSHQTDICLIEVDGRTLLFAATPQGGVFHPAPVPPAEEQS